MEKHLQMECKYREKKCEFCGEKGIADHIDTVHREPCVMRIMECPNGCKMPGIRQNRLSVHVEAECPLRIVSCSYARIGCDARFQFNRSMDHNENNVHEHFRLMSKKMDHMNTENEELQSMCNFVETTCNKLQEQYNLLLSLLKSEKRESKLTDATDESEEVSYFSIHNQQSVRRLMRAIQRHPPILHDKMAWLSSSSSDDGEAPPLPPRGYSMSNSLLVLDNTRSPSRPLSSRGSDSVFEKGGNVSSDLRASISSVSEGGVAERVERIPPPVPARSDSISGAALKEKAQQTSLLARRRKESSNSDVFLPMILSEYQEPSLRRNRCHTSDETFRGIAWSVGEKPPPLAPLSRRNRSLPSLLDHVEEQQVWESEDSGERGEREEPQIFVSAENPAYALRTPINK